MNSTQSHAEEAGRPWDADLRDLDPRQRYKLLAGLVVPRPIALVSTLGSNGVRNAAPYSFFNVFSEDPPIVAIGIGGEGTSASPYKDTLRNVLDTGEFVVNLVDEPLLHAMNVSAIAFPSGTDEFDEAGFVAAPSVQVAAPRIAAAPVAFECRRYAVVPLGDRGRQLLLGEIVHVHVRAGLIDPETLEVEGLPLIGRLHGRGWYARTTDRLEKPRITLQEWEATD
ncbi:MAG: flavin reductase family protein [Trueperaceae bacterium]|nr:flavin reductase family protein [Trueperaceae bacterium]